MLLRGCRRHPAGPETRHGHSDSVAVGYKPASDTDAAPASDGISHGHAHTHDLSDAVRAAFSDAELYARTDTDADDHTNAHTDDHADQHPHALACPHGHPSAHPDALTADGHGHLAGGDGGNPPAGRPGPHNRSCLRKMRPRCRMISSAF
jgi:hypothetical protein